MTKVIKITMDEAKAVKTKGRDTPVLDYCRKLIKEGKDPSSRLEVYRHRDTPDVIVKNIGEGAKLTVIENNETGPVFGKYKPFTDRRMPKNAVAVRH